jgi:hypothetical protein
MIPGVACAEPTTCFAPVVSVSNPGKVGQGDLSPNVLFDDAPLTATSVGYGAAGGRSDEITIADGRLYLVRPDPAGGVRTRHAAVPGEGALMLQVISPASWSRPSVLGSVASLDDLERRLDGAVIAAGCPDGARLAFRIEGRVTSATWSLDTLPARAAFTTLAAPATIVGLYTTVDGARPALPARRRVHAGIIITVSYTQQKQPTKFSE